jgi:hypothetical protein
MKDPVVLDLVNALKTKLEDINSVLSALHEHEVIVQLSVGRDSVIEPTAVKIVSLIQTHDYL